MLVECTLSKSRGFKRGYIRWEENETCEISVTRRPQDGGGNYKEEEEERLYECLISHYEIK